MKNMFLLLAVASSFFLTQCKKDDLSKLELGEIIGTVDGTLVSLSFVGEDTADNCYSINFQDIDLERRKGLLNFQAWQISINNVDLDNLAVPVTWDGTDDVSVTYSESLLDPYVNSSFDTDFRLTLSSRTNDRLQGTFSGTLYQVFGSDSVVVTDGGFDIEIIRKP